MNRFIPPLIVLVLQDSSLLTALRILQVIVRLSSGSNNTLTHGKLQRCQTQRSDMQIRAEIMQTYDLLRYHGRWILTKTGKKLFFAVQIEKTEINILQRKWEKKLFYFSR